MAQPHPLRRTKRLVRRREELNSSSSSADESKTSPLSRVFISHSPPPLSKNNILLFSPSTLMTTHQRTIDTQTTQDNQSFQSKSIPSFAETQLLSIYYLNRNISNQNSSQDSCIFVEQQQREPIRFRANYDPLASTRSTQTSPPIPPRSLSTHGSTLIIDANQQSSLVNNRLYEQRLKIHSGSQRLANLSPTDEPSSPSEFVEESRYSYEEYIIHVDNPPPPTTSSPSPSTSSVTTIIAQPSPQPPQLSAPEPIERKMFQPDELDSDRTSRLSGDDNNTHSSTSSMSGSFTNQDWPSSLNPTIVNTETNARISSWPPVPYDLPAADTQFETSFVLDESDEQRRPSRVQFAEQLVRVIPPSATNSLSEESVPMMIVPEAPAVLPRSAPPTTNRTVVNEQVSVQIEEDENTTTTSSVSTTTSSNQEAGPGRLQRTSGLTNLNEVMMKRPNMAPPPPPPPLPPPPPPVPTALPGVVSPTSSTSSGVDPRLVREQLQRLDYQLVVDTHAPVNQSKWVKEHLDATDIQSSTTPAAGRVDALRSLFEQHSARSSDSSTINSPPGPVRRREPEERPARHGDEIRFRIKEETKSKDTITTMPRTKFPSSITTTTTTTAAAATTTTTATTTNATSTVAPLTWEDLVGGQAEIKQQSYRTNAIVSPASSVDLEEVRRITGRRIKTLEEVGSYQRDGRTWKWDGAFWFSLTASQRDQLKQIPYTFRSRQDSGDTQIYEFSDRSAYQGDSEDNTPKKDAGQRRSGQNSSQENLSASSSNELNRTIRPIHDDPGSTVSITGAGAWQHSQPSAVSTGIGRYTEASTIHEDQPTVSVFGSTPTATYTRIGSQESLVSSSVRQTTPVINKKNENQTMIVESGYSSADEPQQRVNNQFRPKSSTIMEEPSINHSTDTNDQPIYENLRPELIQQHQQVDLELDPYSYEQFIYDYFSTHARRLRASDDTLVLLIDGQQIAMPHIRLPASDRLTLSKNVYLDAIDEYPPPFETELDQLVIFFHGEPIVLPADRWMHYKNKFERAEWIHNLDRVNRRVPTQVMPVIEQWLADHTTFLLDSEEMNVDGLNIPLIGRSGRHILDIYHVRQLQSTENLFWSEILKYLIRSGYVSFDPDEKIIHIAQSELDAHRLLDDDRSSPSPELVERLANLLRSLDNIHFDNTNGEIILGDHFRLSQNHMGDLFETYRENQTLNAQDLAERLLNVCQIEEEDDGQTLVIRFDDQILRLSQPSSLSNSDTSETRVDNVVRQWLGENIHLATEQGQIFNIRYRSQPNCFIRITGDEGIRLANSFDRQTLDLEDLIRWHETHAEFDRDERSIRLMIKPNRNLEIVNLSLEENIKGREKNRTTNEKMRSRIEREVTEEEKKNLVFFIPLHPQTSSDNEQEEREEENGEEEEEEEEGEKEEKNYHHYHRQQESTPSPPTLLQSQREEQKKVKTISDDDDNVDADERRERALFLQSISSLLHFVNANGSDVGTLELIQGRRLRLSLTGNSEISAQQQILEFNEDDTHLLHDQLQLDIDACTEYLVDRVLDRIQFDSNKEFLYLTYRGQMLKLKNLKQKFLQPAAKKLRLSSNKNNANESSRNKTLTEEDVVTLTEWLDGLNQEGSITITEQNDIVILPHGDDAPEQQIFINHDDVDTYMETKAQNAKPGEQNELITMADIARILLAYDYVQYSEGQLTIGQRRVALDRNELFWLRSIIQGVRPNPENRETAIDLFDGENTQVLHVPYEHMAPTNNPRAVADYLFQNGHVRYDVDTGNYAYRYVAPDIPLDDETEPAERLGQRQLLRSHIRQIHVDEDNQRIEIEFLHDPNRRLPLPSKWYRQIANNNFDRAYIIDLLLQNGGIVTHDTFTFNDRTYSLQVPRVSSSATATTSGTNLQTVKLSSKQRQELIENYVEDIHRQDGIKRDNSNNLLLLQNETDGSQLYLTPEHTKYIQENQFRRQDLIRLLTKNSQIKQDEFGNWLLYYNNQYIQFPADIIPQSLLTQRSSNVLRSLGQRLTRQTPEDADAQYRARLAQETQAEFIERYHKTIEYMYRQGFIVCDRRLKLVRIHFSNQTLTLPLGQLRPIVDTRILNSGSQTSLPFESRQLSQWLLANSEAISNTREGYIQLTHKNKNYNFPLINPANPPSGPASSGISALVKRFGLSSRSANALSRIDFRNADNQIRCANHLLEKLDKFSGINIDNATRTLVLSMTPDDQEQLIIRNPAQPVTKQTLIDYLTSHGRFALTTDRSDIEYRHFDDGRVYRFHSYIRDWEDAFGETGEERIVRVLGEILALNGRFLQRADRQIIISLRNGERFIIPAQIGSQLLGPVNGQTIAELLVKYADDIHEEQDGKILVVRLADQTLRLQQQRQLMSSRSASVTPSTKTSTDPKLKLLFPFNKSLRQINKTPSTSTLNVQPPDASNGYAIDPLLMLANYIYRAGSIYQDDAGRLVIKMNEDEIVVPRIEAINAIETINTSPQRTGTIVARLIDRIGKVQSNKAGGLIVTIGKSSFELPKELLDRANQLHRETIDSENDLPVTDQDLVQTGLNGSMTLAGRHNRQPGAPALLPLLRQSKSVGSLSTSTIGHPWFTDDQQMLYSKDGRGDARYLNLDNYSLEWQKEAHKHGLDCDARMIRNVTPYFNVLGYTEKDGKKGITINDLTRIHPEMLSRGRMKDANYLAQLEDDRAQSQTTVCPKPRILVIPDDETMLSSNRKTRFYVQYMYEHDSVLGTDPAYVMMLPKRFPVRPTVPQLIAPHHYRDISLRDAPVYVHKKGEGEVYFENLGHYLSSEHPDLSSQTVRRMLKFNPNEFREYLSKNMSAAQADQLAVESEEPTGDQARYVNVSTRTGMNLLPSASRQNRNENDVEDEDEDLEEEFDRRGRTSSGSAAGIAPPPRTYINLTNNSLMNPNDQLRGISSRSNGSLQPSLQNNTKLFERSPSTSSLGSDMIIANSLPTRRSVLGNAPSPNIPLSRNDQSRTTTNPLSSLTDENYGRSLNTTSGSSNPASPEKNGTLPRSATLSGQSIDGESEGRATVSRSASAVAKVITSKSDTVKSTSSSAASSREQTSAASSSVARAQSLVSPSRTTASKAAGDDGKKEKKSKFRTPSFLKKRKEKRDSSTKDKP